jgi:hypothetical protein
MRRAVPLALLAILLFSSVGCYAPFSPEKVRAEIVRQTGQEPQTSFEFKLGGATMKLAKTVASKATGEPVNFGGLTRIELAVFEVPQGKPLDLTRLSSWGWDTLIKTRDGQRSFTVFVRTNGETLGDLVLVAEGEQQVLYGRLKGKLDRNLPSVLERALRGTGLKGLKDQLLDATREQPAPQGPPR